MLIEHIKRVVGPLERRVRTMLMRGTLNSVDDSKDLQQMQVDRLDGETLEECERVGQWGFTSNPPAGCEVIVGQIGSNADHQVILGVDDSGRPHPIDAGQTIIYDQAGTTIKLDATGNLVIIASGHLNILAGNATLGVESLSIVGDLMVSGNVTVAGLLNGHTP